MRSQALLKALLEVSGGWLRASGLRGWLLAGGGGVLSLEFGDDVVKGGHSDHVARVAEHGEEGDKGKKPRKEHDLVEGRWVKRVVGVWARV